MNSILCQRRGFCPRNTVHSRPMLGSSGRRRSQRHSLPNLQMVLWGMGKWLLFMQLCLSMSHPHLLFVVCRISLYRNAERIPQNDHMIVQEYIDKPLLIEGFKCDMRIYVLVTCCDPLRIFLYNDGLLRMGTEKYVFPTEANIVSASPSFIYSDLVPSPELNLL